ncbi:MULTISPECIES: SDR family NAD(P)-dependent oxidoreductase [unclassified Microbacterium]|uniref:SDR family NAD(P)-dependent oxidoreductase n=1 Tax=unclassified Microbacterium TaxID=2609290 RepID=UPI0030196600
MSALEGTVALITGASSGIGAATARALAAEGAAVALVARRADRLDAVLAGIAAAGGSGTAIVADITERSEADAAVARAVGELGRLDILVNNAGLMLVGPIEQAPIEEWDRMIDLNLTAALSMTKAALPHLLASAEDDPRRVADVVNISSTAGRQVKRGSAVYNLTKHGLGAFSESFRQEFSARYVRMALVEPGAVDTELRDHIRDGVREGNLDRMRTLDPLQADDIAEAVGYIVTRPRRQTINELLIRPTLQND